MENSNGKSKPAPVSSNGVETIRVGGLSGRISGTFDGRPPLVLLHGLTFNRAMWDPALDILLALDPARQVLSLDLPGHGDSDPAPNYGIESVVALVHSAVEESGLVEPVMVGHSLSAIVVTLYAGLHPVRSVINVDQPLQTGAFAALLHSLAEKLNGPGFMDVWQMFEASFHTELLPPEARKLLRATCHPTQELVLGYWRDVLDGTPEGMEALTEALMAGIREKSVPYVVVAGSEPEPAYRAWLAKSLPQATIVVFPDSGHFPHLAHPRRFAESLAATSANI